MITVEINDAELDALFLNMSRGLADMSGVFADIGELIIESTKNRFGEGVAPDGTPWAPKSAVTLAAYERRGDRADPRPLHGPSGDLAREFFSVVSPLSVEVASTPVYAAVMQFGAAQGEFGAHIGKDSRGRDHFHSIPWGDIPARPFLGVSDEDRTDIIDIVEEWLLAVAAGSD